MNPSVNEEEKNPRKLAPGDTFEVSYVLLVNEQCNNLFQQIYQILNIKPEKVIIHFKDFEGDLMEVIVQDAFSSSVFFRSFLEEPLLLEIPLPQGIYSGRTNFFPAVCEELIVVESENKNTCILQDIPKGTVKVKIINKKGEFVPGKVVFIGLDPTKSPYFNPENGRGDNPQA